LPLLGDPGHSEMIACLQEIAARIPPPAALVVISAHWEESVATITSAAQPPLLYDYYNFPKEAYQIRYPCPGEPSLAKKIHQMLGLAGIASRLDATRGLDHGVFVPLKIMYPNANIPCVEVSLQNTLDPSYHIAVGKALRQLCEQNVLVIGSGSSFHNFRTSGDNQAESERLNESFEQWLQNVCCDSGVSEEQRANELLSWAAAPGARYSHPREEHLLPLHVCYGVAESPCSERFELSIMGRLASMYCW